MEIHLIDGIEIMEYKCSDIINKNKKPGRNLEDFDLLGIIEENRYSATLKVKSRINYGIYAMKKISFEIIKKYNLQKIIDFFSECDHPNIIKCFSIFDENDNKYIIMEYMDNGDLESYIESNYSILGTISGNKLLKIFYHSLCALDYIHKQKRNIQIKLKNIFIDNNFNIKVGILNFVAIIENFNAQSDIKTLINSFELLIPIIVNGNFSKEDDLYILSSLISEWNNEINMNILTSNKAVNMAKESFINNYVKNSSLNAIVNCFNKFKNVYVYFSNNYILDFLRIDCNDKNKIISKPFLKIIEYLNEEINQNHLKNVIMNDNLYELRKALKEAGFYIKSDNSEILPEKLIPFILIKLSSELNEIRIPKNKEDSILSEEEKKFKLLSEQRDFPEFLEKQAFNAIFNIYNEKVSSFITRNFLNFIKTKSTCKDCSNTKIHFSWMYYIHINVPTKHILFNNFIYMDVLTNFLNNKTFINEKVCKLCKRRTLQEETWEFCKIAKNLIIILDRGKNYKNDADIKFDEKLILKTAFDKAKNFYYKLVGIISKMVREEKYIYYILNKNNRWISSEDGRDRDFSTIQNQNLVICLFYELEQDKQIVKTELSKQIDQLTVQLINYEKYLKNLFTQKDLDIKRINSDVSVDPNNYNNINFNNKYNNNFNNFPNQNDLLQMNKASSSNLENNNNINNNIYSNNNTNINNSINMNNSRNHLAFPTNIGNNNLNNSFFNNNNIYNNNQRQGQINYNNMTNINNNRISNFNNNNFNTNMGINQQNIIQQNNSINNPQYSFQSYNSQNINTGNSFTNQMNINQEINFNKSVSYEIPSSDKNNLIINENINSPIFKYINGEIDKNNFDYIKGEKLGNSNKNIGLS